MGELSHPRGGGETPEADRTCRPGNEGKAPLSPAHLMQKRALIAMQYSALHHRTWITPTVPKPCGLRTKRKSHDEFYDSSWDFGALEGTRIPGPLIKRIQGASFVKFQKFEEALFLSYHRKTRLCTHRIVCIQCNALQPLSSYSDVQKVCKNVQTGKTKPNGQINHRFYGRV